MKSQSFSSLFLVVPLALKQTQTEQNNVLLQIISPKIIVNDFGGVIEKYCIPLLLKNHKTTCRNKKIVTNCSMVAIRHPDIARLYGFFSVATDFSIFFCSI